ncbi:FMN-binding protein MioC [Photobacterium swingsii]|uniref:FMN-binding protein MioC n=1 Tax=Photobacterium swingsii TaxID=680026 RepID=UPI0040684C5B
MSHITLITGSTLGGAEYVADHLAELLEDDNHTTETINRAELSDTPIAGYWLVVCSTHGAGELPDNIQPFMAELATNQADLSQLKYGVIGLGDSSYDTFCAAAKIIDQQLTKQGAQRIGEPLHIDMSQHPVPEDPAENWLTTWKTHLGD